MFLINFALGLVTGIVQEFQFGMNWSDYSRFVGDIFGAPLAVEGLLAFFLESTFLGPVDLRLGQASPWPARRPPCGWRTWARSFSAWFILAANSWMQHPVGYDVQPGERPRRAGRFPGRDVQQGPARHLPARRAVCLHDRRRVRRGRRGVSLRQEVA
ncbi:MAG: cytochrome ubiquinol oxidase subunit I [Nocardioides sp.]